MHLFYSKVELLHWDPAGWDGVGGKVQDEMNDMAFNWIQEAQALESS